MKKFLSLSLAALMTVSLLAGCGSSNSGSSAAASTPAASSAASSSAAASTPSTGGTGATDKLTMGTGGVSGTYYGFGSVLAQYVSSNTGLDITAVESGGSQANIEAMEDGENDMAFSQSDVMSYAYTGTNLFAESGKVDSFSVAAALYMEQVQIVTTNPDIKTVADLKGKSVSIGAAGSGTYYNAIDLLGVYGLTENDINATYQSFGESADALKDGKIDAAFVVAGAPTTAITDLSTSGQVYLVSIDDEHVDKLIAASPYYSKYTVSADTYGMPEDAQTVAVAAMVLARNDVSEDAIYTFVSTIFDNADQLQHGKAAELSLEFASSISSVPYHPGAARYFAEKGFDVA